MAVVTRDFDRRTEKYAEIGIIPDHADSADFRKAFKSDLRGLMGPLYERPLRDIRFKEYFLPSRVSPSSTGWSCPRTSY